MTSHGKNLTLLLILIMALSIPMTINSKLGIAQSGTNVSGIISQNTTWTRANSPYILTGNLLVDNGVTLTIQPGVTININSNYIEVNGTLVAIGTSNNMIQFNNGAITFTQFSTPWNGETNSGSTIQYSVFNGTSTQEFIIALYTILFSNNIVNYPLYDAWGSPIISNNIFNARTFYGTGGGAISSPAIQLAVESGQAIISNNVISGFDAPSIEVENGKPIIEENLITYGEAGIGIEPGGQTGLTVINNTIADCEYGIYANSNSLGTMIINSNNLENNSIYNLYWQITNNLNATYNWWGTTDSQAIGKSIYDFKNDFSLGTVTYAPFLTAPNPQAPSVNEAITNPTPTATQSPTPSPTQTPASTATVPELSWLVIPPLLLLTFFVAAALRLRKNNDQNQ